MAKLRKPSNHNQSEADLWRDLALEAQKGDKKAYRTLLNDILPYIKKMIVGQLANPEWADDIAQDVLMSVHKSLHTFQPDRPFKPWLRAITNFRKTDYLRKHYKNNQNGHLPLDVADFMADPVTDHGYAGELKDIEAAMGVLSDKQRRVFQMVKIEGQTIQDVAKEMNMSPSAVKVSAHRSMKALQKKLTLG